jgi:hypothetical protein
MPTSHTVRDLATSFVEQITSAIDGVVRVRVTAALDRMFSGSPRGVGSLDKTSRPPRRERRSPSPAAKRARKLQGQYLGALRRLTGHKRSRVKAIAKKDGVTLAIAAARRLSKKG